MNGHFIAACSQGLKGIQLCLEHLFVVHFEQRNFGGDQIHQRPVGIDPNDGVDSGINACLLSGCCLLDSSFGQGIFEGFGHPTGLLNFLDSIQGLAYQGLGPLFQQKRSSKRIHPRAEPAIALKVQLGVTGNAGRIIGWQGQGFVQGVGMQALGSTQDSGQGLQASPGDVVVGVLLGEAPARGLAMGSKRHRLGGGGPHGSGDPRPQQAPRAQFGYFGDQIHPGGPKKREPWAKFIQAQAGTDPSTEVFHAIRQGIGQFQFRRRTGFVHVVTRYANGIEAGQRAGTIAKYFGNDLHGRTRWVDIGVANHKLLEDIVLNGSAQLMGWNPAFFGRNNKKRQDGNHRSVHGHANRQLVQRQIPE